jgi:hypothetical protein
MGMATPRVGLGGQRRQLAAADRQLLTQINSPTFEELQGSGFLAEGRWGGYSNIGREEIVLLTEVRGRKLISQREMNSIKIKGCPLKGAENRGRPAGVLARQNN